uniref:NADH-ubiquinone oxidoreductase chain 4 n=1 Tax=Taeniogonalos taihorina TaxID=1515605 RepID=A0A0K0KBJ5_9HYME|nr:NADH dehydrogenase subunit 4 [Taeniogonalos taihorina]AIE11792.1 NADH dehydrogenase subunit 4 [Taeniogonalos taihorina]
MKFFTPLIMMIFMNMIFKKKFLYLNNLIILILLMFSYLLMNNNNSKFSTKISLFFMIDYLSFILIILTIWITMIMIMTMNNFMKNSILCMNTMILLNLILTILFSTMNWLMFYILFEMSLIPTLFLILGWGNYNDRIKANSMMMMYTMIASLPLFMYIILTTYNFDSFMMFILKEFFFYPMNNFYYFMMITAFLVKLPMFIFHMWLPKAHVEAPVFGSMILAAIMLKLGSYGILKLNMFMKFMSLKYSILITCLSILGAIILSFVCLFNYDMKIIVAYSSVVHMSMMISCLMNLNYSSINGSINLMISHGLCSSGLFCLINLMYMTTKSRSLTLNKGIINLSPPLTLMCFLLCSSNMSAPPSLNLLSELFLITSLMKFSIYCMILIMMLCFFSSIYSIYLFTNSQYLSFINMNNLNSFKMKEFMMILLHWMPLNLIFLNLFYL